MGKIKQFVKDHEEVILGTIIAVGGAAACTVAYKYGLRKGSNLTGIGCMAMIYADLDGTAMIVEKYVSDLNENDARVFADCGNKLIRDINKELA